MAVLVAIGGAALGSAIGIGASAGWLVGSVVGQLLFPPRGSSTQVEGPRLGDLSVTSSAYGAPIPISYGTLRMAGSLIWSSGFREQRNVTTTRSGGKGGGKKATQTTVTYSYFCSFALAFGEGPAADVLRIWADGKLIFDKTGTSDTVAKPTLKFRFHGGAEDQLPDPLIEAAVGAGNAPAHRGLISIVFEDLPLADFGNRLPNITAEIAYRRSDPHIWQVLDKIEPAEGGLFDHLQRSELAIDWQRNCGYFLTSDVDASQAGIRRFDLASMRENRQARMSDITATTPNNFPDTVFCGSDGFLYLICGAGNTTPIVRIDPDALREAGRFGIASNSLTNTPAHFVTSQWMGMVSAYGSGGRVDFLLTGSVFNDVGLLRTDAMTYVWGAGQSVDEPRIHGIVGGRVGEGSGDGWILAGSSPLTPTAIGLYRITVSANASYAAAGDDSLGVTWTKLATIIAGDLEAGASAFYSDQGALSYDTTDDSVIFQAQIDAGGNPGTIYTVKWRADTGIVWKTATPVMVNYDGPCFAQYRLQGQRWTLMRNQRIVQLDTATGIIVYNETWTMPFSEQGAQTYDSLSDSLIVYTDDGWVKLSLNRGGGEDAVLGDIVADLCRRVGLTDADIDVTGLTDAVAGYVIGRQTPVRSALEPLASAFFFDGVESDDVLAFAKRGAAPVAALVQRDLIGQDSGGDGGIGNSGDVWRERRTQEVELPARVSVVYLDRDADYQQGTQSDKRAALPVPTMASSNVTSVDLPVVLNADSAKRIAQKTLYSAWIERASYEASTGWRWLRLDPADVIDVTLDNGATYRARLTRCDLGADLRLALKAVAQEASSYTSSVTADRGSGVPAQIVAAIAATRLFLLDVPLLRDADDTGGTGSRLYCAMAGYGPAGWPGAGLYRSADGSSWTEVGASLGEVAWGATVNALGSPRSPFATDNDNHLNVFMTVGGDRLESVTQEAMVNGANAALLLKANGEPEVIQFRDVAFNPDGSYTLTGLLRGRRGTDVFVEGHAAGETFLLLDADDVETLVLDAADIGVSRAWRAAGFGTLFEDAATVTAIHTGRDLKPYAPWDVRAGKTGSPANILLTWVRRTRLAGSLRDGTSEVPLGEVSEAYEVDILAAPGGAVKRTLASSTPAVTYLHADILTDFGVVPATLPVAVYQLGAFGRGFPRAVTLEVL